MQSYLTVAEDTSVILGGILEEACARILLIDTLGLSELFIVFKKSVFKNRNDSDFSKERLSSKPSFSARCRRRRTNHICEPIRKRMMTHSMIQYFRTRIFFPKLDLFHVL